MTALDRTPCPHCCTPMVNGRCPDPNCQMHWQSGEAKTSNLVAELLKHADAKVFTPELFRNARVLMREAADVLSRLQGSRVETPAERHRGDEVGPRRAQEAWYHVSLLAITKPQMFIGEAIREVYRLCSPEKATSKQTTTCEHSRQSCVRTESGDVNVCLDCGLTTKPGSALKTGAES